MRLTTLHKCAAHDEGAWSVAWVPGSNKLLTGSVDESVKVWEDKPDGIGFVHTYQGHTLGVVSVATDAQGEYAASSALDSYVRVWSLGDHEMMAMIEAATTEAWSASFSPIRQETEKGPELLLAVAGGTRAAVVIWGINKEDSASFKAELSLPAVRDLHAWRCDACMHGGRAHPFLTARHAYSAQVQEDKSRRERFVLSVAHSPDGQRLACGAMDGTVCVFDTATGAVVSSMQGHFKPVRSLTFMPGRLPVQRSVQSDRICSVPAFC